MKDIKKSTDSHETIGICKLCQKPDMQLVDSHIIPDFVFRWLRDNSVTGHFRSSEAPNRRTQRGLTRHWLCSDCDNKKFGDALEFPFANKIFHPFLSDEKLFPIKYDHSLLRFCVSVLWRVLLIGIEDAEKQNQRNEKIISLLKENAEFWREFLVDENAQYTSQDVYLLPLGCEGSCPEDIGSRMHAYSKLSIDMGTDSNLLGMEAKVFAKIGPFVIFSPFAPHWIRAWEMGRIYPLNSINGILTNGPYEIPVFFKNYLLARADENDAIHKNLSTKQKDKIEKLAQKHFSELSDSSEYKAALLDYMESEIIQQDETQATSSSG